MLSQVPFPKHLDTKPCSPRIYFTQNLFLMNLSYNHKFWFTYNPFLKPTFKKNVDL